MGLDMNWVDLVILAVLAAFALEGLGRSFISEIFDLLSFIAAFLLSLKYYNLASAQLEKWFSLPHSLANVLGLMAVWYLVETLLFLAARLVFPRLHLSFTIPGERFLSMIPSLLKGLVFISILLVLVATFPIQPKIKEDVKISKLGSLILSETYLLEAPLKNAFGGLANDTLTFLTIEPKDHENVNIGFKTNQFKFDEQMEFQMIDLVNKERSSLGVPTLTFDASLRGIAREHSADMMERGYFSHYTPEGKDVADRAQTAGINFLVIGENLAYAPSLQLAHNGLMNSPGHRANILSEDFHKIGIGIANGGDYGIMFTQNFSN